MLWNGGYIPRPQIAFVISCHMLLQIKFHANIFYGIVSLCSDQHLCVRFTISVYIYNLDFDLMRFHY